MKRFVPASLAARVLSLHAASFLLFALATLVVYGFYHVQGRIDQVVNQKTALLGVMGPMVTDSVVIGDFDTIKRLLERAAQDPEILRATFIDRSAARISAGHPEGTGSAPGFVERWVERRLIDTNEPITAGGRDYGVLRIEYDHAAIAQGLWTFFVLAAVATIAAIFGGIVAIGIPLRRWLRSLDRVTRFDAGSLGESELQELLPGDLPRELQATFRVMAHNAAVHRRQVEAQLQVVRTMRELLGLPGRVPGEGGRDQAEEMTQLVSRVRELVTARARDQLALSNQKFALDEHAVVAVFDTNGRFLGVNSKFTELVGFGEAQLLGRTQAELTKGLVRDAVIQDIRDTVSAGKVWHGEIDLRDATGTARLQQATVVPFLGLDGRMQEYIAIYTDVSARRRAEADLLALNESLEQRVQQRTAELLDSTTHLQQALDREREFGRVHERLSGMLSHEFRTPLSVITSATELISGHLDELPATERSRIVGRLERACNRMTSMLEDALTIGRLTGERYQPQWAGLGVRAFLEGLIADASLGSGGRRKFIVSVAPSADITIESDERLLHQVMSNLLTNADKYSPGDSVITVDASTEGDQLSLSVTDLGRGIAQEDLPRLFEPFYRCTGVELIPGTGLGLSICKKAAELFGGDLTVKSVLGKGSTFTLTIALRQSTVPAAS